MGVTSMQDALKLQQSRYSTYEEIQKLDLNVKEETEQPIYVMAFDYSSK